MTATPEQRPLLLLVEMLLTTTGREEFETVEQRMLEELRSIDGLLEVQTYRGPGDRHLFYTVWRDREAVQAWVENAFHRDVLMANFRNWAAEATFNYWDLSQSNPRARRCPSCGRWSQIEPGWRALAVGARCPRCGAALEGSP